VASSKTHLGRSGLHAALIEVPDRLTGTDDASRAIAGCFARAVNGDNRTEAEGVIVEYKQLSASSNFASGPIEDRLHAIFLENFGKAASSIVFHGRLGSAALAIGVRSAKKDKVLGALANEAKRAAEQCSGTRPAVIAMALANEDWSKQELTEPVRKPSGLHAIVRQVLREERRRHVDSIAFTLPPSVQSSVLVGITQVSGLAGVLYNPNPTFASDLARTIFIGPA
jgi:hypothetical protein